MDKKMISIIMPTWDRKDFAIKTIESVLSQTYKDFEFIIADDGSTDGIVEVLEEYARKDKRIKLIKKKHTGCTDTFNIGFKAATGDAICIIGSDDLWLPNKLERQVEVSKDYPDFILHNNSIGIDVNGNEIDMAYFPNMSPEKYRARALIEPSPWFVTSSWYIPKHIFNKVGLFEGIYNDYQWMVKAIIACDMKLKLIPEFLTKHRSNPDSNTFKHVGQVKFNKLAKEIQKTIIEEIGTDKLIKILSSIQFICIPQSFFAKNNMETKE